MIPAGLPPDADRASALPPPRPDRPRVRPAGLPPVLAWLLAGASDAWTLWRRAGTARSLAVAWLIAGLALALWGMAAGPGVTTRWPEGDVVTLAPSRPAAKLLAVWVRWDAPLGSDGWVVLEPGARWPRANEPYWRRRVHPGWNLVTWSPLEWLPPGAPVTLRLAEGRPDAWGVAEPWTASHHGLRELGALRGLLAALAIAALAAVLIIGGLRRRLTGLGRWHLALLGVTAVGLALRLRLLGAQSLWFDEILTAIGAQSLDWVLYTPQIFGHPPLQYLIGWLAHGPGGVEVALRWPFVVAGAATIVAVGVLSARLLGRPTGLLAALALACSPLHVELSQTARPYAPFLLLAVVALLSLLEAIAGGRRRWWLLFTASAALAVYAHYLGGILLLLAAVTAAIALSARGWRGSAAAVVSFAGVVVLLVPLAPALSRLAAVQVVRGDPPPPELGVLVPPFLGAGLAAVVPLVLIARGLLGLRGDLRGAGLLASWAMLPVVLLWSAQPQHLAPRHLALLLIPLSLLVAHGAVMAAADVTAAVRRLGARSRWPAQVAAGASAAALAAAWILPVGATLADYYGSRRGYDWREVATVLDAAVPPGGRVLATIGAGYPLRHYWRRDVEVIDAAGDIRLAECGDCWVVVHLGWDRPRDLDAWLAVNAVTMGEVPASWSLPGLRVWRVRRS